MNPLRMIVQKHYRDRLKSQLTDPERLAAVYGSRFWQQPDRDKLREFCVTACAMLNAPVAHLNIVTDTAQYTVAAASLGDEGKSTLDFAVCQNTVGVGQTLSVKDMRKVPLLCDLGAVTEAGAVAYLGVPLLGKNNHILGAFCVLDFEERSWTDLDVQTLTHLASALVSMHEVGRFTTDE